MSVTKKGKELCKKTEKARETDRKTKNSAIKHHVHIECIECNGLKKEMIRKFDT